MGDRRRPRFSIFGVGPYTFAPWKVAISGLHKQPHFLAVPPQAGQPVLFDDAVYLHPCADEAEARQKAALLNGSMARDFLNAVIFWEAKRPITAKALRRLSLDALAQATGVSPEDP